MAKDISLMERDELIHEVLICNDRLLTLMSEHLRLSSEVKKLEEENNALQLENEKLRSEMAKDIITIGSNLGHLVLQREDVK